MPAATNVVIWSTIAEREAAGINHKAFQYSGGAIRSLRNWPFVEIGAWRAASCSNLFLIGYVGTKIEGLAAAQGHDLLCLGRTLLLKQLDERADSVAD